MHYKTITQNGQEYALVPVGEYERLVDVVEDKLDAARAKEIIADIASGKEEVLPFSLTKRILEGENPLKVWREYRGFATQQELADRSKVSRSTIAAIESGRLIGGAPSLRTLANILRVDILDIMPNDDRYTQL